MELTFQTIADHKLPRAYGLLTQLRKLLTMEDFVQVYTQAKNENQYTLVGAYHQEELVGLVGYRVLQDDVKDKQLYVDDLVIGSSSRERGIGSEMLKYTENLAGTMNCKGLRLSTEVAHQQGSKSLYFEKRF